MNFIVTISWDRDHMASIGERFIRGAFPFCVHAKDRNEAAEKAFKNADSAMFIPKGSTLRVSSVIQN